MAMLTGKVAIVTGAGQGIGRGIALVLAREGASLVLQGRTEAKLRDVAREIESFGGTAIISAGDVRDPAAIAATVELATEAFGGIDILVNNAQDVPPPGPLLETPDEVFQAAFDSGPMATFRFMKACHSSMAERGGGSIINLATSAAMRWDMSNYGPYAAVKEAIRILTRAAAAEFGKDNIRTNTIAPLADSPLSRHWQETRPEEARAFIEGIPLGRLGDSEADIGRVVLFLVSPDASYLNGATLPLDGGYANFH